MKVYTTDGWTALVCYLLGDQLGVKIKEVKKQVYIRDKNTPSKITKKKLNMFLIEIPKKNT